MSTPAVCQAGAPASPPAGSPGHLHVQRLAAAAPTASAAFWIRCQVDVDDHVSRPVALRAGIRDDEDRAVGEDPGVGDDTARVATDPEVDPVAGHRPQVL